MRENDDFGLIDCDGDCYSSYLMNWVSSIEGKQRSELDLQSHCQVLRVWHCCSPRSVQEKSSLQRCRDGRNDQLKKDGYFVIFFRRNERERN